MLTRFSLAAVLLGATVSVSAHEVWVNTAHTHSGQILKAELGYGHYPEAEPIPAERLHIFPKPLQLVTPQGT